METKSIFAGIKKVVYISTDVGTSCKHCSQHIGCSTNGTDDLSDSINHYIESHGYRLLHVGTETSHDMEGKLWHSTVAVLGTDDPPPEVKPPKVKIEVARQKAE